MKSVCGQVEETGDAMVSLRLRTPGGVTLETRLQVDTGFNGEIGLSSQVVQALRAVAVGGLSYVTADGSSVGTATYEVEIEWLGRWRRMLAVGTGGGSLLGMQGLYGHRLIMEAVPGGRVEIAPLPASH